MIKKLLLSYFVCTFFVNVQAQDVFILPTDHKTDSQILLESKSAEYIQNLTEADFKNFAYNDLRKLFLEHDWINISVEFLGYFSESEIENYEFEKKKIQSYGAKIINSLPENSFRDAHTSEFLPRVSLNISEPALYPIFTNSFVTSIFINRYGQTN